MVRIGDRHRRLHLVEKSTRRPSKSRFSCQRDRLVVVTPSSSLVARRPGFQLSRPLRRPIFHAARALDHVHLSVRLSASSGGAGTSPRCCPPDPPARHPRVRASRTSRCRIAASDRPRKWVAAAQRLDRNPQKCARLRRPRAPHMGLGMTATDKTSSIPQTSVIAAMTIAAWSVTSLRDESLTSSIAAVMRTSTGPTRPGPLVGATRRRRRTRSAPLRTRRRGTGSRRRSGSAAPAPRAFARTGSAGGRDKDRRSA